MVTLEELLRVMMERKSSDLHITAGSAPRIRVDGALNNVSGLLASIAQPNRPA